MTSSKRHRNTISSDSTTLQPLKSTVLSTESTTSSKHHDSRRFKLPINPSTILRYVFLFPLLLLVHLIFTISSIVLRTVQDTSIAPSSLERKQEPPKHLALVLVPPSQRSSLKKRQAAVACYVKSVQRAIQWAGEWGVSAISVWDGQGLGVQNHSAVTEDFENVPLSQSTWDDLRSHLSVQELGDEVISTSINIDTTDLPRRVEVHFLPPSAADVVASVARDYVRDGVQPSGIQQQRLDKDIKAKLHFHSDPDLLIIHHLDPPGFWRGLLPRPAPELWGYPAWPLRITEIYAHPPPLPLFRLTPISPLLDSTLPILRKLGSVIPDVSTQSGVLDVATWEGAQAAWEKVEQRLGK